MKTEAKIGFGGGCHWCTEGVLQSLKGVLHVDQGWISSTGKNDSLSEAVIVTYEPNMIPLHALIEIHLRTHASTSNHSMRNKYRSAVYTFEKDEKTTVRSILNNLQKGFIKPLITQVLDFNQFKRNKEEQLNYYQTRPEAAFCKTYIDPKIKQLLKTHKQYLSIS